MAAALHLPAISQAQVAKEFPKVWEHRYNVSDISSGNRNEKKLIFKTSTCFCICFCIMLRLFFAKSSVSLKPTCMHVFAYQCI